MPVSSYTSKGKLKPKKKSKVKRDPSVKAVGAFGGVRGREGTGGVRTTVRGKIKGRKPKKGK